MTDAKYSSSASTCACGKPILHRAGPGRPRKYCGPDCVEGAKVGYRERDNLPRSYVRVGVRSFECIQCHMKFDSPRAKKYCGPVCKERARTLRDTPDATQRGPLARLQLRECKCCQKMFKPKVRRYSTYCSRECAFKALAVIRRTAAKGEPGEKCLVYFKVCAQCGATWTARHKSTPTCSERCSRALASAKARAWSAARCSKRPRACRCCGEEFQPAYGEKRKSFCSAACARRFVSRSVPKNARKRARHFGVEYEYVNRVKVFNRDGWKCQICGRPTPRKHMGTYRFNAPELDHRVPISRGGGHTYANVQCSCRECNGFKGNRSEAGQMPLFAA